MANNPPGYFKVAVAADSDSGWRWQLIDQRGQIIASSEVLPTRDAALKTLKWMRTQMASCPIKSAMGRPIDEDAS